MKEVPVACPRFIISTARILGGIAPLALSATALAQVQQTPPAAGAAATDAGSNDLEAIVVSASRLQHSGFDAPTPTTVVSAADLAKLDQPNVFDALVQLPSLQGSTGMTYETGSSSTGLQGISSLSLRGLSPLRTLTLLDGERVVGSNYNGVVDIDQLPQMLIQRTEIVTGGASASWGSDAVAGVVNFVTDKKFEGFKFNAQRGISDYDDNGTTNLQMAAGTHFADGRGHIEVASEYLNDAGVMAMGSPAQSYGTGPGIGGRDWNQEPTIAMRTPAGTPVGQPEYIYGTNAQNYQYAKYGLITAGPLQGTAFGSGGQPYQFQYAGGGVPSGLPSGQVNGCISPYCLGTPSQPGDNSSFQQGSTLVSSLLRANFYTRMSYDLTSGTEVFMTLNYGVSNTGTKPTPSLFKNANLTVQCANPYVPASVMAACATDGITNFQYGVGYPLPNWETVDIKRIQRRIVLGADGSFNAFGKDWTWDTYLEHGWNDTGLDISNMPLNGRLSAAMNAVSGPNGSIACGSAAARASGCIPLDLIGQVPLTPGALNYVVPDAGPFQYTYQRQEAFSASVQGSPVADWAGDVSLATGVEARQEAYQSWADPYGNGVVGTTSSYSAQYPADPTLGTTGNNWYAGNFHSGKGQYEVEEGFIEAGVPLFKESFLGKGDLDLAGRVEDYSVSGAIDTWKAGFVWDTPVSGLRFRALQSRDVRAPNLSEAFATTSVINAGVNNPFLPGNPAVTVQQVAKGNTALQPEKSVTTEFGLVWQPDYVRGLRTSVDYYRIEVKGEISALPIQDVVNLCYDGNKSFCAGNVLVTANGAPATTGAPLSQVVSEVFNLGSTITDGLDIELAYQFDLQNLGIPGSFALRGLANHVYKFLVNPGIPGEPSTDYAGALGNFSTSTTYNATGGTIPRWKTFSEEDYTDKKFTVSLMQRWFASGTFSNNYIVCQPGSCPAPTIQNPTINYNHMPGAFYLDIGASYNLFENGQLDAKINNIGNVSPPPAPGAAGPSNGVNSTIYDVIGRMYYVGVRFQTP
jgi:outer membrane receptor protein involved in Fe transport